MRYDTDQTLYQAGRLRVWMRQTSESGDSSSDSSKQIRFIVWKFFSLLESGNQSNVSCVELETKMAYFHITEV